MPHAPLRPCPRCRRPTHGRCTQCAPRVAHQRATLEPWRAIYQTPEWKALRMEVLREAGYRCQCPEHQGKYLLPRATDVDHLTPHRGNHYLFFDRTNLQAMAKACHSRKTAKETFRIYGNAR
jgi:5-methylcytosine-specific restriction endonuclease McrA